MKKIIASAVGLMLASGVAVTTASAVESQFGGYWRTRAFIQDNIQGTPARFVEDPLDADSLEEAIQRSLFTLPADNDTGSYSRIDNRTRLYYTAKFNDNFKFVNKFEFNSIWGDDNGGDIGADGDTFKVKNSYADFNLGNTNTKLGIMPNLISRGFIYDDDNSGITVTPTFGNVSVPIMWIAVDADDGVATKDNDRNMLAVQAKIKVSDALMVVPHFTFDKASGTDGSWYLGADVDWKGEVLSAWGTLIYNGGESWADPNLRNPITGEVLSVDNEGWLAAAGLDGGMWWIEGFYASGDDDPLDGDKEGFSIAPGASYYWAEIMGLGIFDNQASNGSLGNWISNIYAIGGGAVFQPMDKMKISTDAWYAALAEDNINGDTDLGFELDGKLTYELMENLSADFVLAYLFAGDATGDDDVFEGGVRVSLKF